jgi:DNA-binding XRE family transcriptional regulator
MAAIGFVSQALKSWREDQRAQIGQLLRNSVVRMPFGQRIRNLRTLLGWSQRKAAAHFGVSVRTVIRHERRESCRPWLPLLLEVRALEDAHAEELIALLVHAERSELSAGGGPSVGAIGYTCRFCYQQLVL